MVREIFLTVARSFLFNPCARHCWRGCGERDDVRCAVGVRGSSASCSRGLRVDPRGRQQDRAVLVVVRPCSLRKLVQVPGLPYVHLATSASASEVACAAAATAYVRFQGGGRCECRGLRELVP